MNIGKKFEIFMSIFTGVWMGLVIISLDYAIFAINNFLLLYHIERILFLAVFSILAGVYFATYGKESLANPVGTISFIATLLTVSRIINRQEIYLAVFTTIISVILIKIIIWHEVNKKEDISSKNLSEKT